MSIHRIVEYVITCDAHKSEQCQRTATQGPSEEHAKFYAASDGWQECMGGKWVCPICAKKQNEPKEGTT